MCLLSMYQCVSGEMKLFVLLRCDNVMFCQCMHKVLFKKYMFLHTLELAFVHITRERPGV